MDSEAELELLVKISPPVHVRVVPPQALIASVPTDGSSSHTTSDIVENFMSSWTRLVGDPVLSKWIVMVLAISISLNGYLLKGIAAGLGGKSAAAKGGVHFSSQEKDEPKPQWEEVKPEKTIEREPEVVVYRQIEEKPQPQPQSQIVAPKPRRATSPPPFTLEDVSIRLKTRRLTIAAPPPFVTPPSSGESSASSDDDRRQLRDSMVVRSLEECLDIFDNGPRPLSASLSLLSDEELVLLAQNGKIAAYALEKVLGPQELERAVRIRRSLVCEYCFWLIYSEVLFLTW